MNASCQCGQYQPCQARIQWEEKLVGLAFQHFSGLEPSDIEPVFTIALYHTRNPMLSFPKLTLLTSPLLALQSIWNTAVGGGDRAIDAFLGYFFLAAQLEWPVVCERVSRKMRDTLPELVGPLLRSHYRTLFERMDDSLATKDRNSYAQYRTFFVPFFESALQLSLSNLNACSRMEMETNLKRFDDPIRALRRCLRSCDDNTLQKFEAWVFEKYHRDIPAFILDTRICLDTLDAFAIETITSQILNMPKNIRELLTLCPSFIKRAADVLEGFVRDVLEPSLGTTDASVQALQTVACISQNCRDCTMVLSPFIEDLHKTSIRIRAKEEVRVHIEALLSRTRCWGVRWNTDTKTYPYTLCITKPESLCQLAAWARKQSTALRLFDYLGDGESKQKIFGDNYSWVADTIAGKVLKKRSRSEESISGSLRGPSSKKPRLTFGLYMAT
ncbi:hypothetical protein V5O48_010088 [Marasmius crinis-equi]|uniref:Uncharacterized protein n=1 Tax=Marasmius crinis-equi TaxID=585013 RepID=A0ABR3F9T1_9AGAR